MRILNEIAAILACIMATIYLVIFAFTDDIFYGVWAIIFVILSTNSGRGSD